MQRTSLNKAYSEGDKFTSYISHEYLYKLSTAPNFRTVEVSASYTHIRIHTVCFRDNADCLIDFKMTLRCFWLQIF